MRRKRGLAIDGWLALDKPQGLTSTQALSRVKRLFHAQKAGHAGTLDPLATGILPIAFGEATKTVSNMMDGAKTYRFTVRWGAETDTDDAQGQVAETSDVRPGRDAIAAALHGFTGEIQQAPPAFSAIKVGGKRAYDLARKGETPELAPRTIRIDRLDLLDTPDAETSVFETDCGKGAYVRALARDMARALGTRGHVVQLRRTRVGCFHECDAISLDMLETIGHSAPGCEALFRLLKPTQTALDDIPALAMGEADAARLKRGQPVLIRGRDAPILTGPVYATSRGILVALGEVTQGELRPTRVFNLAHRTAAPPSSHGDPDVDQR